MSRTDPTSNVASRQLDARPTMGDAPGVLIDPPVANPARGDRPESGPALGRVRRRSRRPRSADVGPPHELRGQRCASVAHGDGNRHAGAHVEQRASDRRDRLRAGVAQIDVVERAGIAGIAGRLQPCVAGVRILEQLRDRRVVAERGARRFPDLARASRPGVARATRPAVRPPEARRRRPSPPGNRRGSTTMDCSPWSGLRFRHVVESPGSLPWRVEQIDRDRCSPDAAGCDETAARPCVRLPAGPACRETPRCGGSRRSTESRARRGRRLPAL